VIRISTEDLTAITEAVTEIRDKMAEQFSPVEYTMTLIFEDRYQVVMSASRHVNGPWSVNEAIEISDLNTDAKAIKEIKAAAK